MRNSYKIHDASRCVQLLICPKSSTPQYISFDCSAEENWPFQVQLYRIAGFFLGAINLAYFSG